MISESGRIGLRRFALVPVLSSCGGDTADDTVVEEANLATGLAQRPVGCQAVLEDPLVG